MANPYGDAGNLRFGRGGLHRFAFCSLQATLDRLPALGLACRARHLRVLAWRGGTGNHIDGIEVHFTPDNPELSTAPLT